MPNGTGRAATRFSLLGAALVVIVAAVPGCASGPAEGALQLVVADQTMENPPRDVVEIRVDDGAAIYPDSAAGGSPTEGGEWIAGETLSVTLWPEGSDEAPYSFAVTIPDTIDAETLSFVIEIEDNDVSARVADLGFDQNLDRENPVAAQREADAALAAKAAEEALAAEQAALLEAEKAAEAEVQVTRSDAALLGREMRAAKDSLYKILDEHDTVYGDDNLATYAQIERKFKDYTTAALEELHSGLKQMDFTSDQVATLSEDWHDWWTDWMSVTYREEGAARNDDTTAMDAVAADYTDLWDRWADLFERIESLASITAADL